MNITLNQVEKEAVNLSQRIVGGEVIALIGPLGSGKTTFTQHLAKALGVTNNITSPTFVIMQEYQIPQKPSSKLSWLYHLDLYQVKDFKDLETVGINQIWERPETITVIEWADKISDNLPENTIYYYLS